MAPDPTADGIRQHAHEILQRAEFNRHESLLERFFSWLGDHFPSVSFGGGGGGPGFLGDLVTLALLAGIVVLLVLLVRALMRRVRVEKPEKLDDLSIELEDGRDASDWRSEAERLEAAGQWREAMRARYRELVRSLIEDGVLDDLPGRTTGEYRFEYVKARPTNASPFGALTDLFEGVWYGGIDTDASDNQRFRQLAAEARRREPVSV